MEELSARAKADALEAALPTQINLRWQCRSYAILRRMQSRARFDGHAQRFFYPQVLREPIRLPYQPFLKEDDDN